MFDPRQMQQLMKQLNMKQEPINAKKVIFDLGEKQIIISNPSVTKVSMQGRSFYQVEGEESTNELESEEDIKMIIDEVKCTREKAIEALKKNNGKVADAILYLQGEQ